jgi:thioredoxin
MKQLLFVLCLILVGCEGKSSWNPVSRTATPMLKPSPVKKTIVYDFWAPWCPPCRAFGPTFEKWKEKYSSDTVSFVKVNTDEDKDLAVKYKVSALPTILVVTNDEVVGRFVGAPTEEQVANLLK